ncbi:alpha-hydroxy-acid oxidizing protein [Parafannyhessea umbonata]|uniref:alpha-hydroxy-acid oxidizing protein n=1 Tax=Parafannyhessea umbonata TaxID=604330 RepID=UPI003D7B42A1
MEYKELATAARGSMGPWCKACPVCDGRACGSHMPGPGSKGAGTVAARNYAAWQDVRVRMDTIHEAYEADTSVELFGRRLSVPVMVGPLGDVKLHYGDKWEMEDYNSCILHAAAKAGSLAWTGDGMVAAIHESAVHDIGELGGCGIPTIKPWNLETVMRKLELALAARPVAVAMDIDAAGLPFLKGFQPPAGPKSVPELRRVADACHTHGTPFVLKGIMGVRAARKAAEAGADAIVVSNHGGRVQDGVPATAEVLPAIAREVGDGLKILVDGGIRSGLDVFRALALGANACLVCRPFAVVTYGAGAEGVSDYFAQLARELKDTMEMCGARTVADIDADVLA